MNRELRILILEDRPSDAELVMHELRKSGIQFAGQCVATEVDFVAQLRLAPPDLILADYSLPAYDGLSALAAARKECPEIPFIFVSGSMGEETAIEALHLGATDYVLKQRLTRLGPAVRRALREIEEHARRQQAEQALRASEQNYREIFNATSDAILVHDAATGAILDFNQTTLNMFGYSRKELLALAGEPFSHQEAVRRIRQAFAEGPQVFERHSRKKNGELFWTEVALRGTSIGGKERVLAVVRDVSERKQADEALRVSEDRFRSVWEHSIDGMRLTDRAGRILAVNEAFCRLVKVPREKLIGQVFPVAYEGHGSHEDIEAYQQRFDAGTFEPRLMAHLRLWNSEELDVEVSTSFVESGLQRKALLSLFRDIGERKRAEARVAAFSHLGQQLSAAMSAREAGEIIVAAADLLLGWDACSFALYSAEENVIHRVLSWDTVDGRRIESIPPDDHARPLPLTRRVIEEGGQLILKEHPDEMLPGSVAFGNTTRPSASILFVPARAGAEVVAVLSIQSYTPKAYDQRGLETLQMLADHCAGALKRIRAQEALSTSEALYQSLVQNVPQHIFRKDATGRFTFGNGPFCKSLGKPLAEILGKTDLDFFPAELAAKYRQDDLCVLQTGQPFEGEETFKQAGGESIVVNVLKIPLRDVAGQIVGVQGISWDITDRKRAAEALAQERHLLRTLIDNLPDYVFVKDAQSRFVLNNQAHLALLKAATQAELVGKTDGDIFPPELAAPYYADEQAVLRSGEPLVNREESTVDPAGKVRWLLTTKVPVRDEQGKITGLAGVSRDITERKQAELQMAAFSKLGQRLSAAKTVQEAGELIVEVADQLLGWDACSFALYSSAENLLDYVLSRDTVDGRRIEDSPSCDKSPPSLLARRVIKEGGQLILKEKPDQAAPGGMPFGDKACPSAAILFVPARAGSEVVAVLSIHSYTPHAYDQRGLETLQMLADHCAGALQRIRAQEALSTSEANYRSLVECSPNSIFLHQDEKFVYANLATLKLLGAEQPQQLLGRSVFDIVPPRNRDLVRQRIRQAKGGEAAAALEQEILRLDGTALDVEVTSIPFVYKGKPAVQTVMRDISGRKQLEQQLRQSQKMDAIGQLAGGVAHDFNNMLAVIRGNAELVLMEVDQHTPATNECLKQIMAASERAANLTRQLLVFSRKQIMQSQPLVLNKVIAELTKMLKRIIGEHIDLECRYADPLPFVQADAGMLEQVLLNLAVNARDAMPNGGHLLIATDTASFDAAYARNHPGAGVGEFVRLTVTDTGTGIAPEHLPRIFEPFFTTKGVGKGTGLGLATVYGIVQQHQGWIEVSSQPAAGATFKIFLPVIPSPAAATAVSKAETQVPGGAETILLVEDEYAVRAVTRRVLESRGYRIYEATTVREALEVWRGHAEEIDLLLTDIIMPQGLTGRELAEQLRAQRPALKIIFMSGYSADVIGKDTEFFRRTKISFLQKPCSARTILETVRRCLDEK